MSHESQTAQYKSLMFSLEEASEFHLPGSSLFEAQPVPSAGSAPYLKVLGRTFEDTSGYPTREFPGQAPVRFGLLSVPQNLNSLTALGVFLAKVDGTPRSLAAVVDMLVSLVSENEDGLFASLTAEDHQRLTVTRDKLIAIVGEDENHLLRPLLDFVSNLIKNYDEASTSSIRKRYRPPRRSEQVGRSANRPRVKLSDLLLQESDSVRDIQDISAALLKPRRSEQVGRSANRPRVKLSDLLAREAEHIVAEERDAGTPVDSEAW